MFYVKLYVHSLVDELKWFYENARCYNKIYNSCVLELGGGDYWDICNLVIYFHGGRKSTKRNKK